MATKPVLEKPSFADWQEQLKQNIQQQAEKAFAPKVSDVVPESKKAEPPAHEAKESAKQEAKEESKGKMASFEDLFGMYKKNLIQGMPKYDESFGKEYAQLSAKEAVQAAKKESEAARLTTEELSNQSDLIRSELNLQNEKFNQYIASNEQFQKHLDEVQAKYPAMTRSDIFENMSTTEKLATSLLTVLGGMGHEGIENNPAYQVFNENLNQAVQKQSINYQRALDNLKMKKDVSDKSFQMQMEQINNDLNMKLKASNNLISMIDLSQHMKTPDELKLLEDKTKAGLDFYNQQLAYNARMAEFQTEMEANKYAAALINARGKNLAPVHVPVGLDDKGMPQFDIQNRFVKEGIDPMKFYEQVNPLTAEYESLAKIRSAYMNNASKQTINTLVNDYNDKFTKDKKTGLPGYAHFSAIFTSVEEADPAIKSKLASIQRQIMETMDQMTVPYSQL